ncbi:hypothetical protein ACFUTU_04130 [Arthrobacter sp. NPDC057388]|jgi:hypothetical protein|uniref:hypothetical protein n=1 Tax=Arthrobacter sp. NPDC057388 TaxID=3346116 RepID=UPI0036291645
MKKKEKSYGSTAVYPGGGTGGSGGVTTAVGLGLGSPLTTTPGKTVAGGLAKASRQT